jgi:hypothetical protein
VTGSAVLLVFCHENGSSPHLHHHPLPASMPESVPASTAHLDVVLKNKDYDNFLQNIR